jgi:hypothetical protein
VREGGKFRGARNIAGRSSNAAGHADFTRRIAASVDCALFFVAYAGIGGVLRGKPQRSRASNQSPRGHGREIGSYFFSAPFTQAKRYCRLLIR